MDSILNDELINLIRIISHFGLIRILKELLGGNVSIGIFGIGFFSILYLVWAIYYAV